MLRSVGALVLATLLFGLAAALFAELEIAGAGVLAWTMLGTAVGLLGAGLARGSERSMPMRATVVIGIANAAQLGLYVVSLRLAPVGLASALHLTSPVWLLAIACARRRRPVDAATAAVFCLVSVGLGLAALTTGAGGDHVAVGLGLALLSSGAIVVMLSFIKRHRASLTHDWSQGIVQLFGATVFLPLAVVGILDGSVDVADGLVAGGIGLLLYAPGGILVWLAIARASTSVVAAFGLLEAPFAALIAAVALGGTFGGLQGLAMAVILAAALLEARVAPDEGAMARAVEQ